MKLTDVLERKRKSEEAHAAVLASDKPKSAAKTSKVKQVVSGAAAAETQSAETTQLDGDGKVTPGVTPALNDEEVERVLGAHPQLIYIDQIDLDPNQPRKMKSPPTQEEIAAFSPDTVGEAKDHDGLRALARSIYIHNLLSPLVVDRSKGRFKLIAGERRYWAVRLLGWKQVPAVIWGQMAPVHRLALQITENLQREDLSREAKKEVFLNLVDAMDGNVSEVCRLLSISRTAFYRTVGDGTAKKEKRISSGQLVRILGHMKDRLPNMARPDQEKVLVAVTELQDWIQAHLASE
jgi:ParB/RepB/Spo0J family partition protein